MNMRDRISSFLIATITQHRAGWGTDCGIALAPLDAKRTGSNGYGGCMAEARSAIAPGMVRQGPPLEADRGAHPFWPGDRAMHGTVPTAVAPRKNPLNLKFSPLTQYARASGVWRCGNGAPRGRHQRTRARGATLREWGLGRIVQARGKHPTQRLSEWLKNAYGGVAFFGGDEWVRRSEGRGHSTKRRRRSTGLGMRRLRSSTMRK